MEIFRNNSGVNVTVEELYNLFEHDMFDELVILIAKIDAAEDGVKEDYKVELLLNKISSPPQPDKNE